MTNTIIQLLIKQRYEYEYVNRSYEEMVSRFRYELNEYKNEKYLTMIEKLEEYLSSNDWLANALQDRIERFKQTGNNKFLSKPLTNEDISNGVADTLSEDEQVSEVISSRKLLLENFYKLYNNYLELTNMLVDRLEYIFDANI